MHTLCLYKPSVKYALCAHQRNWLLFFAFGTFTLLFSNFLQKKLPFIVCYVMYLNWLGSNIEKWRLQRTTSTRCSSFHESTFVCVCMWRERYAATNAKWHVRVCVRVSVCARIVWMRGVFVKVRTYLSCEPNVCGYYVFIFCLFECVCEFYTIPTQSHAIEMRRLLYWENPTKLDKLNGLCVYITTHIVDLRCCCCCCCSFIFCSF